MSYCVNCGVELRDSEKKCPLCNTEVINHVKPYSDDYERAYPVGKDSYVYRMSRNTTILLISFVFLIPCVTCILCEFILSKTLNWSLYVVCGMALLWVYIVPLLYKRTRRFVVIACMDALALLIVLLVVQKISGSSGWFIHLALPLIVACTVLMICAYVILRRVGFSLLKLFPVILCFSGLLLISIEIITDVFNASGVYLTWSIIAFIPQILVAGLMVFIDYKMAIKSEVKKKLHM